MDNTKGTYTLASGRTVFLSQLVLSRTFAGSLEGSPETISRYIRKDLARIVEKAMYPGKPLVIIGDETPVLPQFRWIAEFDSNRGVRIDHPDYSSRLFVCWFTPTIDDSFASSIEQVLALVDWESNAEDYDVMP